ncbi:MAG: TonB-dependent receptor [Deltaproteobacteria bacterium]|nr:TonB-dependent receptor [Myxococcales bacterium]MDP3216100.1 TonB-dependent receptor [Deltaproteobacteria bacterium]
MNTRNRTLLALSLTAALGALPRTAQADERTEARRHFRAGLDLVTARQYVRAIEEFQAAYAILPNVNVLYNIARAYSDLGDTDRAIDYYQRYLQGDVPDRAEVEATLRTLEQQRRRASAAPAPVTPVPATVAPPGSDTPPAVSPVIPLGVLSAEQIVALRNAVNTLTQLTGGVAAATPSPTAQPSPAAAPSPVAPPSTAAPGRGAEDTYEERVVTAALTAQSPLDSPNATTVITAQDIRLSGLSNVAEMLRRAVGVDVMALDNSDQQVGIRGFNRRLSNRVLVLVDGRSVYLDFIGVTLWSLLPVNPEEIERIEVIRGPGSALYGADAYSGVVNIITRTPGEGRNSVTVSAGNGGVFRTAITNSGRAGNVGYRTGVGYEQGYTFGRLVPSTDLAYRIGAGDTNLSLQNLHADIDLRSQLSRSVSVQGGLAATTGTIWFNAIGPLRRFWTDITFVQPHLQLNVGGFTARAFMNHVEGTSGEVLQRIGTPPINTQFTQDIIDVEARYQRGFRLGGIPFDLTLGGSYRAKHISWSFLDADHLLHHFAGFVQAQARFTSRFSTTASLRVDRHPVLDSPVVSPRLALVFKPTPRRALRLTGATSFRTPTMLELYLNLPNPSPVPGVSVQAQGGEVFDNGQQRLSAESAVSIDLGWQDQTSDRFQYELGAFFMRGVDLIELTNVLFTPLPGASNPGGLVDVGRFRFANDPFATSMYGVEAAVRVAPTEGLDLFANYTFAYTQQQSGTLREGDQRTPQHKLNLGAQVRTAFGLDLEVTGNLVSSQVWREQDFDVARGVVYNTYPLDTYFLLNGRVGYRALRDRLEFGVTGTNLTDNRARQHPFGAPIGARVMATVAFRY